MRSNSVPPSLDDRSIALRFKQLDRELNDWVIIHFKSTEQRVDLSPELREILISQVPLFDRLLQQPRSRTTVLRAVVGHVIQQAFESGEFVGVDEGLGALERSMGRNTSETEFNKWRSQTFLTLSKASTTESKAQVVATISQRIDNLLSPFSATPNQPERLHFLSRIIESAATLASELGCQLAKFKVLSEPPETPFHSAYMEDVYQEHETQTDPQTGKSVNALDGKIILAVVFPSVVKWGNERGEGYEEMTVLLKTRVLT
ncbi:hypothetical protein L873DRAFT_1676024 [Choiromyces venosus 120613-1]|uniref:Uncharacterized protein n=1 Tax=Choiromyces venosus 120613-1 TaxID=1336337 RepID=A0A3N4JWM7_9PEZI|nr:hypothetical protein L873DRAFT_1676024 [Choiromyces venosus 120613-1]